VSGINWYEEVLTRKDDLLRDLSGLLKIESVKDLSTSNENNPMGKEIGEALQYMLDLSTENGLETTNMDGFIGYADYGNSEDYIAILGHIDVVPAPGKWITPPFQPTVRNGMLYARGAIDDKGPTIAAFYALKIVKELGLPLKHKIRLIIGTDEESGMRCMKKYVQEKPQPLAGFAPDADFPLIHAEKGQINVKLVLGEIGSQDSREVSTSELISFASGDRGNMVPGSAQAQIRITDRESLQTEFEQFCSDHNFSGVFSTESDVVRLTLEGKAVHGMEPQNGVNAGLELGQFLKHHKFQREANQFFTFLDLLHRDYYGENLGISFSDDITGPLTINAGILDFSQGDEASIQLNIRCPVHTNYEETIEKLKQIVRDAHFKVDTLLTSQPHHVEKGHPLIKTLQKVYEEETGQEPTLLTSGGATYAKFMKNGVAFGACFPGREMTAHQIDEHIEVEDLLKATAIYARAIYELGNLKV
jgi:succinyl-diaminopimelate desuccinylase